MNNDIRNAMRLISAFIALMVGDRVTIRWNDRASLSPDGEINLPLPKTGDAAEVAMLTRLAVHEAGHKLHTVPGYDSRLSQEELAVFNALEDPRMEAEQARAFPGAPVILSRGLDEMLEVIQARMDGSNPIVGPRALQLDLLLRGSLAVTPSQPMMDRAPRLLQSLAAAISEQEREAINIAVQELPRLRSSLEAETLAREFMARLRPVKPPPAEGVPDQEPSGEGQDADNDDASQGKQDGPDASANPSDEDGKDGDTEHPNPAVADAGSPVAGADAGDAQGSADAAVAGDGDSSAPQGAEQTSGPGGQPEEQPRSSQEDAASPEGCGGEPNGAGTVGNGEASEPDPIDLGELLREAHAARYGQSGDQDDTDAGEPEAATQAQLDKLSALLVGAKPGETLEELLEACTNALAAVKPASQPETHGTTTVAASGAGYSLASEAGSALLEPEIRLQGVQSRLVTVLQRELQDKRRRPSRPAHAGGRVAPQRFWRLNTLGDTRIFNVGSAAPGIDAAATVLLDKSASMRLTLEIAAEIALAFSLALQRLGKVRTSVATFPGSTEITETLQMFGEAPRACVRKCGNLVASGGTPLGAAMVIEMSRLLEQRRPKNLLVVVTDDQPGDPGMVLQAMLHAAAQGISVVGVSIGCDIRAFMPRSVSICDATELPDALAKLFREDLTAALVA